MGISGLGCMGTWRARPCPLLVGRCRRWASIVAIRIRSVHSPYRVHANERKTPRPRREQLPEEAHRFLDLLPARDIEPECRNTIYSWTRSNFSRRARDVRRCGRERGGDAPEVEAPASAAASFCRARDARRCGRERGGDAPEVGARPASAAASFCRARDARRCGRERGGDAPEVKVGTVLAVAMR
eukprot:387413-Prymnesium_polylepis.2